jgi:hypothetical protein
MIKDALSEIYFIERVSEWGVFQQVPLKKKALNM